MSDWEDFQYMVEMKYGLSLVLGEKEADNLFGDIQSELDKKAEEVAREIITGIEDYINEAGKGFDKENLEIMKQKYIKSEG